MKPALWWAYRHICGIHYNVLGMYESSGPICTPYPTTIFRYLYTNSATAFKERCFGYTLCLSGCRQSAVSHTSGKN